MVKYSLAFDGSKATFSVWADGTGTASTGAASPFTIPSFVTDPTRSKVSVSSVEPSSRTKARAAASSTAGRAWVVPDAGATAWGAAAGPPLRSGVASDAASGAAPGRSPQA